MVKERALKRISDCEVESEAFAERFHVVVSVFTRVVGAVDSDAEVGAYHEHADVHAEAAARAEREVLEEVRGFERAARAHLVGLQKPDVAGVDE